MCGGVDVRDEVEAVGLHEGLVLYVQYWMYCLYCTNCMYCMYCMYCLSVRISIGSGYFVYACGLLCRESLIPAHQRLLRVRVSTVGILKGSSIIV
jgi:hypothetical protein